MDNGEEHGNYYLGFWFEGSGLRSPANCVLYHGPRYVGHSLHGIPPALIIATMMPIASFAIPFAIPRKCPTIIADVVRRPGFRRFVGREMQDWEGRTGGLRG